MIANGENAASGFGITPRLADELFEAGVEVLTGGNHIWDRNKSVELNEGEFIIVPRGIEHRPVAEKEVHVILFEPAQIRHTGNVESELTVTRYERI